MFFNSDGWMDCILLVQRKNDKINNTNICLKLKKQPLKCLIIHKMSKILRLRNFAIPLKNIHKIKIDDGRYTVFLVNPDLNCCKNLVQRNDKFEMIEIDKTTDPQEYEDLEYLIGEVRRSNNLGDLVMVTFMLAFVGFIFAH